MTSLILSDNDRQLELIGLPPGIYLADDPPWIAPLTVNENSYATSIDMEGSRRVRSRPLNPEGSGAVHIDEETDVDFWDSVDNFLDLVASAHRNKGTLTWTAPEGDAITFELEAIHATSFPQNRTLRQRSGTIEFEFTCAPYGLLPEEALDLGLSDSGPVPGLHLTGPIDAADIEIVDGHVDARGTLILQEIEGVQRDDITIAIQENYDPDNPEPLRLEAADLDALSGTLVGDNIEGTTTSQWTGLAATGEQPHRGRWRVFARIEVGSSVADALDVQARLVYRAGDGPLGFTDRPVVIPHLSDSLIELDLGVANIGEVSGTHSWSGQVQFKAATAGRAIKLRELLFMPATGYARARAPRQPQAIESVVAYDDFAQAPGALDGQTAPAGGAWDRVAGDTDDFTVGLGSAQRSTINDSAIGSGPIGILERLGTGTAAAITSQVDVSLPTGFASGSVAGGLLLRHVDAANWLVAVRGHDLGGATAVYLMKVIASTPTILSYSIESEFHQLGWYTIQVFATDAGGGVAVFTGPRGGNLELVTGIASDPDLATGGALDDGGYGLHDASSVTSGAPLRLYDNFQVSAAATAGHVIHPDESLRFTHEKAERENAAGTRWGRVPHFEGARLKVPPSTRNNYVHRLVVKQDRNDLTQLSVGDAADELAASLTVRPRVLLTS